MDRPSFSNEQNDILIKQNIEIYGWHVNKVEEEENKPAFGYSIGLYESYNHPELILIGPEVDVIHFMINKIGEAITTGIKFKSGFYYPSLIKDANLYFSFVNEMYYNDYIAHAQYYYHQKPFPVLQCLYPAPNGSYPGQPDYPQDFDAIQPFLGNTPIQPLGYQNQAPQSNLKLPLPQFI